MEASLRRAQRLFPQALKLHDLALKVARPEEIGFILLNKSATLEQKGDFEASIDVLDEAAHIINGELQPRLRCVLRFNQAANLSRLGRAREAAEIVPEVRELAERLRNDLDLVRTLWLEGNVAAGLGRRESAVANLEQVRRAFEDRKLPYDYALASLDLALLYREEARFAEIQALAGEILVIFEAQGVHREAIAAVILFQEAAKKEQVTTELVRRLADYLRRAEREPGLRFAPPRTC
jgi:tetratricopeptide (TPR) repeat protein